MEERWHGTTCGANARAGRTGRPSHGAEVSAGLPEPATSPPVELAPRSGTAKRVSRQASQEVCPWNVKFARVLPEGSPFAPREFIAGKDTATLARDLLALDEEGFRAAFSKSSMKRAKLAGLQRNARVVLANASNDHGRTVGEPTPTTTTGPDQPGDISLMKATSDSTSAARESDPAASTSMMQS